MMAPLTDIEINRILGYLRQDREAMEALLQRLALVESPSGDAGALARILAILAEEMKSAGMRVRPLDGRAAGLLYARQPRRSATSRLRSTDARLMRA